MAKHKTHYEDCDVLVVGGGLVAVELGNPHIIPLFALFMCLQHCWDIVC